MLTDYEKMTAENTRRWIGLGGLMTLGASDLKPLRENENRGIYGGLAFKARILPFKADGTRSERPRTMWVKIELKYVDLYRVTVAYYDGRRKRTICHFFEDDLYGDMLQKMCVALDYDGSDSVVNPCYWSVIEPDFVEL